MNKGLKIAIELLIADKPLPHRYYNHSLSGNWSDHRDCHIRPDLVLIYRKPDDETLELVRLGSRLGMDFGKSEPDYREAEFPV